MNLDKLTEFLEDKGFQDPRTGNLTHPSFIYIYDATKEYEFRDQLARLTGRLKRPNHFLDCLVLDLFKAFTEYLQAQQFAGQSIFDLIIEKEKEEPQEAAIWIRSEVEKPEFWQFLDRKIQEYITAGDPEKRVYVLIHGIGAIYPYLRASEFLKKTEAWVKNFKMILFFPGEYVNGNYRLFNLTHNDNIYRATLLNQLL